MSTRGVYHAKAHALVAVHEVAEVLAGCRYGDTFTVSKFMQSAVHSKICFPVLAVSYEEVHLVITRQKAT